MIWYQITHNGWYAIKSNQTKPNQTKLAENLFYSYDIKLVSLKA